MPDESLPMRLWAYQKTRFPLFSFLPMCSAFAVSALCYSRSAAGVQGHPQLGLLALAAFSSLTCFLWLRILDEHKDAEDDAQFRPELPVPSGMVTLAELRGAGALLLTPMVALNAWVSPALLIPLLMTALWAALMTLEFFCPRWLRAHPSAYLFSHMLIMPFIDLYATSLDWLVAGRPMPAGLELFLLATFCNGVVIELGRKIRPPEAEREGVDTYTKAWGLRRAPLLWLLALASTAATAIAAGAHSPAWPMKDPILASAAVLCALPAFAFLAAPSRRASAALEVSSGVWTLLLYLWLGAGAWAPQLLRILP